MMNMLIKLDEERVLSDEKYDLEDMWQRIDRHFKKYYMKKNLPDGSAYYECIPNTKYYVEIFLAVSYLEEQDWFAEYCTKWIWYDNDYNEEMPFDPIDVLARRRKDNPMFAKYARE